MKEPKIPDYTCPIIDGVIDGIKEASRSLSDADSALDGLVKEMENIRTANEQLRTCVGYWKERADDLEKELGYVRESMSDQADIISDLQNRLAVSEEL